MPKSQMIEEETIELLADEEFDEYLGVALSNFQRVTPAEKKKLRGLMRHYAAKKHPFTACVNDNTKRFGKDRAERICAVLKDLIKGTTKWRGEEKKKNLSDSTLKELFAIEADESVFLFLEELDESEITETMEETEQTDFAEDDQILAELYFEGDKGEEEPDADGFIWKTILREGKWKFSPGNGQKPINKPITVVKSGNSDREKLVISMSEIMENFEAGAVEHVTIPASHADKVLENTGFIKKLRISTDENGRAILEAGHHFTEPEVKEKVKRGTIANTSAGVLFDYVHKETGQKFNSVLAHVALTNHPWLNGMRPFGVTASENLQIIGFSEESELPEEVETQMPETKEDEKVVSLAEELGLSDDEIKSRLSRYEELEAEAKANRIANRVKEWQSEGKAPALLEEAEKILMADEGAVALHLSEGKKEVGLSLSDVVERLVNAAPVVQLSEDQVTDEDVSQERPAETTEEENKNARIANFSMEEKAEYWALQFNQGKTEEQAFEIVVNKKEESK